MNRSLWMVYLVRWAGPILFGAVLVATPLPGQEASEGGQPSGASRAKTDPVRLQIPGIENPFRLSPKLYSGGDPHGAESFEALKALGIRTILSVDGATPDVETARRFGLRYVHLPIGYDGVPREQAVRIVKAVETLPGPVYVHCHHGKHRGPTAAALCGIAIEGWATQEAIRWLEAVGTSPDYRGLYSSTREFVTPTAEELKRAGETFPERTKPLALVEIMVVADERWENLKAIRKAGFKATPGLPDIDPSHEALQLLELFRELARLPEAKARGKAFLAAAEDAERHASRLDALLRAFGDRPTVEAKRTLDAEFLATGQGCTACHAMFRDNR